MNFKELSEKALVIRKKYEEVEKQQYGRDWSGEELMLGFMKDVGDLAKLVQAKEGVRDVENVDGALAHELSDCLWSVIVLANKYGVDLETSFVKTMDELDSRLEKRA
jgi:NTP pyrophosphatase (non-canonical NTP hydrolase)